MIQLKALIVILSLSLLAFWCANRSVTELAIDRSDFARRRNLWFAITLIAFVAHNFWIYILGAALIVTFGSQHESSPLAMFVALMMAVPSFGVTIPGLGTIRELFSLTHVRFLSIVILFPAFLVIRRRAGVLAIGRNAADVCLLGYLFLQFILQLFAVSLTATVRLAIYSFTDVFLPYYVASRGLKELRDYQAALMTFLLTIFVMAPVALFEYFRHWLLYQDLGPSMGIPSTALTLYMMRGDNVRSMVTTEHSIALGYLVVVALGVFTYAQVLITNRLARVACFASLVMMLIATGARGPWLGAMAVFLVSLLSGPRKVKRLLISALIIIPILGVMSFTEYGRRLFDLLPFIGTADVGSVDYRQRLFDISIPVILQHPWFGAFDYLVNPNMQELIQGEGIIDVVNTFLGIALTFGGVGLALFCGVFIFSSFKLWGMLRHSPVDSESHLLGRALFATVVGILITIVSVSSISIIAWIYWLFAGLCVGYSQLVRPPVVSGRASIQISKQRVAESY